MEILESIEPAMSRGAYACVSSIWSEVTGVYRHGQPEAIEREMYIFAEMKAL